MKACLINKYGSPEELEMHEVDMPSINEDQLLIENFASSVNPVDWKVRSGALKIITGKKFPKILGGDFAGKIVKKGKNVKGFKVGNEVYGTLNAFKGQAYAEYLIADPNQIALKPSEFSFVETASLPIAGLTALQALNTLGNIKEGNRVFINGCTGGVGSFAVQIARALGAHVTGSCSIKNSEFATELGANIVFDYKDPNIFKTKDEYDIFFDAAAKQSYFKILSLLKKNGTYITTLPSIGAILFGWMINILSSKKTKMINVKSIKQDLEMLNDLIKKDKLKTYIFKQFTLDQMVNAHRLCESGTVKGKVGISIRNEY